jgi:radical SAM superfamily enzyme YgiQ (UPF0313 family)
MLPKKNIYLLQLNEEPWDFLTVLWPSAKTYYEKHGLKPECYNWVIPSCEFYNDIEDQKIAIKQNPPSVFGVSLYVWNYERSLELCKWVKATYPDCIVITGGPHQFLEHTENWFLKYDFIDASLPGEVYGELAICDLLDNLTINQTINWSKVEQMAYPSKSKKLILHSYKQTYKRDFDWNYPSYQAQKESIRTYLLEYNQIRKNPRIISKFETTRGCPFACTFCDWGGGVGSKLIAKDLDVVKADVDALAEFGITDLMIIDSNLGTFGERDLEIIKYIALKNKLSLNTVFQHLHMSGFAKIDSSFKIIKKILIICAKQKLLAQYKISQQSFHQEILDNVLRKDVSAEEKIQFARYLQRKYKFKTTVEIIFGLPGTTLDMWFEEFSKPYTYDMFVTAYEQFVSPGAETFTQEYRRKWGLLTAKKYKKNYPNSEPLEFVCGHNDCTVEQYIEMMKIYMCYFLFAQGGVYKQTINKIVNKNTMSFGEFLKRFYSECLPKIEQARPEAFNSLDQQLAQSLSEDYYEETPLDSSVHWENYRVRYWGYLMMDFYQYYDILGPIIEQWLISDLGGDSKLVSKESKLIITSKNNGTVAQGLLTQIDYQRYNNIDEITTIIESAFTEMFGNLLVSEEKFSVSRGLTI